MPIIVLKDKNYFLNIIFMSKIFDFTREKNKKLENTVKIWDINTTPQFFPNKYRIEINIFYRKILQYYSKKSDFPSLIWDNSVLFATFRRGKKKQTFQFYCVCLLILFSWSTKTENIKYFSKVPMFEFW